MFVMGLKKIINSVRKKYKGVTKDSNVCVEKTVKDVPTVTFLDYELQVSIGQWLGVLSTDNFYKFLWSAVYVPYSADALDSKIKESRIKEGEIALLFGRLLKEAGVENEEFCILSDFDKWNFSFNCCFRYKNESARVKLIYGNLIDKPKLEIDYQDVNREFSCCRDFKVEDKLLSLQTVTYKNPQNGKSLIRYYEPDCACFVLSASDYSLTIRVGKAKVLDYFDDGAFMLDMEDTLKDYLFNLSFPVDVLLLHKMISGIYARNLASYEKYVIRVEKSDGEMAKTTDMLSLKYGDLVKFVVTKNGKIITVDGEDNWSYGTSNMTISSGAGQDVKYSLNLKDYEIVNMNLHDKYVCARQAVDVEKRAIKALLKEKKG